MCAPASAPGAGGRSIVRISGPATRHCLAALFSPDDWEDSRVARSFSGTIQLPPPLGAVPILLAWWPSTASYTRQPTAELHTLGSPPLIQALLATLHQQGVRLAEPGEFTLRAFLAGRIDLTQAEAVLGVIDARSHRELDVALQQLSGGLGHQLTRLRSDLLDALAHVEAELDFVEDDIEFIAPQALRQLLERSAAELHTISRQWPQRELATGAPRVVLRGLPNVGKSSLLNALTGETAAIVTPLAGTTRDYLVRSVSVAGRTCQLIDTAGVEFDLPEESIARTAAQLGEAQQATANLELLCLDATRPLRSWECQQLLAPIANRLIIATKQDLLTSAESPIGASESSVRATDWIEQRVAELRDYSDEERQQIAQRLAAASVVSSQTNWGLAELRQQIAQQLSALEDDESTVVAGTAARCRESIAAAHEALAQALPLIERADAQVLVAAELRLALDELGRVVGEIYTDDLLDRIFSRFCIGK
ncbi:MAG: tRNA modification GTPase [Planctomycetota bacterium]